MSTGKLHDRATLPEGKVAWYPPEAVNPFANLRAALNLLVDRDGRLDREIAEAGRIRPDLLSKWLGRERSGAGKKWKQPNPQSIGRILMALGLDVEDLAAALKDVSKQQNGPGNLDEGGEGSVDARQGSRVARSGEARGAFVAVGIPIAAQQSQAVAELVAGALAPGTEHSRPPAISQATTDAASRAVSAALEQTIREIVRDEIERGEAGRTTGAAEATTLP